MRLLIVEDNVEFAGFLAKGLRAAGYEADVLSSPARTGPSMQFLAAGISSFAGSLL